MKSIKFFAVAAMMAVCTSVSAQFSTTQSSSTTTNTDGWSSFWLEYNAVNVKNDQKDADDESATGFSMGYSQAFPITPNSPLFLEAGFGVQYTYNTNDDGLYYEYDGYYYELEDGEIKTDLFSVKVPVNFIYAFELPNSNIKILPFIGANLRYNMSGKRKYSFEGDEDFDDDDLEKDVFDKKDMGSEKATWKRFQIGWHIGLKARFGDSFFAGVSYGSDFSELAKKTKLSTTSVTIGYTF